MPSIIERLIDSEEHACENAVPPVAEEAAETLQTVADTLRTARELIAEAMSVHIYSDQDGEKPEPDCAYTAGVALIDKTLRLIEPHTDCDECGRPIPDFYPTTENVYHAPSCSLRPDEQAKAAASLLGLAKARLARLNTLALSYAELPADDARVIELERERVPLRAAITNTEGKG